MTMRLKKCRGCGEDLVQPPRGYRLYCTNACKVRAFYAAKPKGWQHYAVAAVPVEPLPGAYRGDEVFAQARAAANITEDYSADWGQNDILGEAVLAILEGRDPKAAVRAERAREKAWQAQTYHTEADVGLDAYGKVVMEYEHTD